MATAVGGGHSEVFRPTKFGGKYTVTLIPGDGVGAEVSESVKAIFKADNVPVEWEQVDVSGMEEGEKHSEELFRESIASLKRNKLGLKGKAAILVALTLFCLTYQGSCTLPSSVPVTNRSMSRYGKS